MNAPQKVWLKADPIRANAVWVFWYPLNETWRGERRKAFDSIKSARAWWERLGCELINPTWDSAQ